MTIAQWQELLARVEVDTGVGQLNPVGEIALNGFESKRGLKLPNSYRSYCMVFGAGIFSDAVKIATPGYKGQVHVCQIEQLEEMGHEGLEYEEYSPNPEQHKRAIFFAFDMFRSYHFFDPAEITDRANNEYAIYTLFDSWEVKRIADNFWMFVTDVCLGSKSSVIYGESSMRPFQVFGPV